MRHVLEPFCAVFAYTKLILLIQSRPRTTNPLPHDEVPKTSRANRFISIPILDEMNWLTPRIVNRPVVDLITTCSQLEDFVVCYKGSEAINLNLFILSDMSESFGV
jgi:hypothetical protein